MNWLKSLRSCMLLLAQVSGIAEQRAFAANFDHQRTLRYRTHMAGAANLKVGRAGGVTNPNGLPLFFNVIETYLGCSTKTDAPGAMQRSFPLIAPNQFFHLRIDWAQ